MLPYPRQFGIWSWIDWPLTNEPPADLADFQQPRWQTPPQKPVAVRNTVGVGDITLGAVLTALLLGHRIADALRAAALAATECLAIGHALDYVNSTTFEEVFNRAQEVDWRSPPPNSISSTNLL